MTLGSEPIHFTPFFLQKRERFISFLSVTLLFGIFGDLIIEQIAIVGSSLLIWQDRIKVLLEK